MPDEGKVCSDSEISSVNRVSIKPPVFMDNAVEGWFIVMEAQFNLQNIMSESTRFYHVLSALPPNVVSQLSPSSLQSQNFSALKIEVLQLFERTRPELFEELISNKSLTGRPSVFMSELQSTARKVGVSDDLVRHKFHQALPDSLRAVLAARKEMPLIELAKLADELVPLVQQSPVYTATTSSTFANTVPPRAPAMTPLRSNRDESLRPFYSGQRPQVCRAHAFFGPRARTCKPWCRWPKKEAGLRIEPSSRPASRTTSPERRHSEN